MIECPHCYTRVLPMADGGCPSCRKNTRDTAGVDPTRTKVKLRDDFALPPVCASCGGPATGRREIRRERTLGGDSPLMRFIAMLFGLLLHPIGTLFRLAASGRAPGSAAEVQRVALALPCCDRCGKAPEPEHVDFNDGSMTFVVHRDFAKQLRSPIQRGSA